MLRALVFIRKSFQYFSKNKTWILSLLFVCSIIRATIWYSLFGINILSYSTLQDLFINFAEYFMSVIVIILAYILSLFTYKPKSIESKIISFIIFVALFCVFNILFRMITSVITLLFIIASIYSLYSEGKKAKIMASSIFLLLMITLIQPIEQFPYYKSNNKHILTFIEKPAIYDIFSFEYNDTIINTYSEQFYYIGGNSNYFFIIDRKQNNTMIIPKSSCSNIKCEPLSVRKIKKICRH